MTTNNKLPSSIILTLFFSSASITGVLITPAMPAIQHFYHVSTAQTEMLMSLFLIGYLIGQLIYSPFAKRFGRLFALRLGLIINLLGLSVCFLGYYTDFSILLIGRTLSALGASSGLVCTFIIINESFSKDAAKKVLGNMIIAFTIGSGAAVSLGGFLTQYFSWISTFIFLWIYGLVLLILAQRLPETMQQAELNALQIKPILASYAVGFSSKKLLGFALIFSMATSFCYAFSAAGPLVANHQFGLTSSEYGILNFINAVGMLTGGLTANRLANKFSNFKILFLGTFIGLICAFMLLAMQLLHLHIAILFFLISALMYFATALYIPTASTLATTSIDCKSSASAATNFINMGMTTLVVFMMPHLNHNVLTQFVIALLFTFIVAFTITTVMFFSKSIGRTLVRQRH